MKNMTLASKSTRSPLLVALAVTLAVVAALSIAGCGGGRSGASVSTLSASNVRYNNTMTVTVNGAGLADPELFMTVDGPCSNVTRLPNPADFQTQFSCRVDGVGELKPAVRLANGDELARLRVDVPLPQVTLNTRRGTVTGTLVVELDPVAAPLSTKNFLDYVSAGLYRNTIFHRVIKDQLIQGGGFTTGPTAVEGLRAPIVLESNNGLKNLRGSIAMARGVLFDSATSQFYFNLADNTAFDFVDAQNPGYAVFGRLLSGLDVMDAIGNVEIADAGTGSFLNLPALDVVITLAQQTR